VPTILCDLDGIVVDMLTPWLAAYNNEWDDDLEIDEIHDWDIHQFVKEAARDRIYQYFEAPEFFAHLHPLSGAIEALQRLCTNGFEIVIATAVDAPEGAKDKIGWVHRWLPFVDRQDIYTGHKKSRIEADVLIDDSPRNIKHYRARWPKAHILTIAYPYNEQSVEYLNLRAHSYKDTKTAWAEIVAYLEAAFPV
jgi:5'-nucleotidase